MRKHFPLHRGHGTQAQQLLPMEMDAPIATPDQSTLAYAKKGTQNDALCPRCQQMAKPQKGTAICQACYLALKQQATETQERQYLARWLHSRVDARGNPFEESALVASPNDRMVALRLVSKARRLGLDWMNPPQMQSFASIMRTELAPFGGGDDSGEAA